MLSQQETLLLKIENLNCDAESHIKRKNDDIADIHNRIDNRYENIVTSIVNISDSGLPKTNFRHFLKPY